MYKRIYSLKNKYDFSRLFKEGSLTSLPHFIVRYNSKASTALNIPLFGIVVSSKISKKAVIRNELRRMLARNIKVNLNSFPIGKYVFIPKKNILGENGKINIDAQNISTEINTFLSKMDIS